MNTLILFIIIIFIIVTISINLDNKINKRLTEPDVFYINSNLLPVFRAIMIPHIGIFIKKEYKNDTILLKHEIVHWNQYKRMGSLLFLLRYLYQFITIGYDTMPLELEARQYDDSLWNYRKRWWK